MNETITTALVLGALVFVVVYWGDTQEVVAVEEKFAPEDISAPITSAKKRRHWLFLPTVQNIVRF